MDPPSSMQNKKYKHQTAVVSRRPAPYLEPVPQRPSTRKKQPVRERAVKHAGGDRLDESDRQRHLVVHVVHQVVPLRGKNAVLRTNQLGGRGATVDRWSPCCNSVVLDGILQESRNLGLN